MIISLIGMSNCGKTFWSRKLEALGFKRFSCDDYIEKRLEMVLKNSGFSGISDVAKWMGQPYDKQYMETSKKYLELERESLDYILRYPNSGLRYYNIVIDTTGSIIYTGRNIMEELSQLTTIVYLDTPITVRGEMCQLYFQNPKPVIWGDSYKKTYGESAFKALKRCYPDLLEYRCKKYKEYAHITLDYFLLRKPGLTTDDFLRLLQGDDEFISEYQGRPQTL